MDVCGLPGCLNARLSISPSALGPRPILINATSLGLHPEDPAPADLEKYPEDLLVYDMIYNPPQTVLLRDARRLGMPAANGLSMLVHQAARSLSYWTQSEVPVQAMFSALQT